MMYKVLILAFLMLVLSGCGHNLQANGLWLVSPYFSVGYGSFACVKDNTKVTQVNDAKKDSSKVTQILEVGEQTTGYDVELSKKSK